MVKICVYLGEGVINLLFHTQLLEVLGLMHFVLNIITSNLYIYIYIYQDLCMNFAPKVLIFL